MAARYDAPNNADYKYFEVNGELRRGYTTREGESYIFDQDWKPVRVIVEEEVPINIPQKNPLPNPFIYKSLIITFFILISIILLLISSGAFNGISTGIFKDQIIGKWTSSKGYSIEFINDGKLTVQTPLYSANGKWYKNNDIYNIEIYDIPLIGQLNTKCILLRDNVLNIDSGGSVIAYYKNN